MIIKIKSGQNITKNQKVLVESVHFPGSFTEAKVLEVIPELSEKDKVLSELFGLGITQEFKQFLAKVVNKVYA